MGKTYTPLPGLSNLNDEKSVLTPFLLRERTVHNLDVDLLSCNDIIELLHIYLPRADTTPQEVVRNIERRHRKRRAAIESARRRELVCRFINRLV
jgi:hypothetical protein